MPNDTTPVARAREAQAAGAIFYTLPGELQPEQVDPLIRDTVFKINESGWVWTGESCQGHPDDETGFAWSIEPFLRLVCCRNDEGRMLTLLLRQMTADPDRDEFHGLNVRLYREMDRGEYTEVLVYVRAATVYERDRGLAAFARFAASLTQQTPNPLTALAASEKRKYARIQELLASKHLLEGQRAMLESVRIDVTAQRDRAVSALARLQKALDQWSGEGNFSGTTKEEVAAGKELTQARDEAHDLLNSLSKEQDA